MSPCFKGTYDLQAMPENLRLLSSGNLAPDTNYDWYWHGYLVVLKPLLVFFNYGEIRWLNSILMFALVLWSLILIAKRIGRTEMLLFLGMLLMTHYEVVSFTMQYASVFFVTFLSIVCLLSFPSWFRDKKMDFYAFFVIGAVTVFVDFLTTPVVSLGLPLLIWILYKDESHKVRQVILLSVMWSVGYASLWIAKWGVCALTFDPDVLQNAAIHADKWSGSNAEHGGRLVAVIAIVKKYIALVWSMNWGWGIIVAAALLRIKTKLPSFGQKNSWLLAVAAIPFGWNFILVNHNAEHFGFTWRSVLVTIYALMLWVYLSIDWQSHTQNSNHYGKNRSADSLL